MASLPIPYNTDASQGVSSIKLTLHSVKRLLTSTLSFLFPNPYFLSHHFHHTFHFMKNIVEVADFGLVDVDT